jgi:hypothetical protein
VSPDFKWSGPDLFVRISNGLAAILFLPFEIRTGYFLASLNRFGMNKIFFITIKLSRLANQTQSLDFKWSDIQMPGTGIRYNPNTASGSVFGGVLYSTKIGQFTI